jgi:hypothetical protein
MVDIEKLKERSSDKYVVRHTIDDSGDYESHYYAILAVKPYGQITICEDIENPYDALLFATAPDMIAEIKELRAKVVDLEKRITSAYGVLNSAEIGGVVEMNGNSE